MLSCEIDLTPCVEQTFQRLFPMEMHQILVKELKTKYDMDIQDLAVKPEAFSSCMWFMFGAGYKIILISIIKCVCKRVGVPSITYEREEFAKSLKALTKISEAQGV